MRVLRLDARTRTGLLVGALSMFFALDIEFLASLPGFVFAPDALGQAFIELLPGWIVIPLIALLQFWAKRLLVFGVLGLFMLVGALAGALAADPRRRSLTVAATGATPWVAAVVLGELFANGKFDLSSILLTSGVGAAVYFVSLQLLSGVAYYEPARREAIRSASRRRVLLGAAAVSAVVALASLGGGAALRAVAKRAEGIPFIARRLRLKANPPPPSATFDSIEQLTPRITDNKDHYVVDTALIKPSVDAGGWSLDVGGAVSSPFSLSYDQLLDLEAVEQLHTLECISNDVGGDLISTALWTGVPLRDLLARAQPDPNTYAVKLTSVDGYTDSIRLEKAMEPTAVVAYLMNGYTLPEEHGYPARLLVPNIYGMKNVKWLRAIECVTFDYVGYWEERGWSNIATVNTNTRIDTPTRPVRWNGEAPVAIAGIAFGGSRGIAKVEVSTDGGTTWQLAELEIALGRLTWVRWKYEWTPSGPGKFALRARSTDGSGATETAVPRAPFPDGSTGYDHVDVTVTRA